MEGIVEYSAFACTATQLEIVISSLCKDNGNLNNKTMYTSTPVVDLNSS